jgi:hypothetical protein
LVSRLLPTTSMERVAAFLTVLWVAGCSGGGADPLTDGGTTDDGGSGADDAAPDAIGPPATNDHCADAISISLAKPFATVAATTVGAGGDLAAPCGAGGQPDVFFKFTLTRRSLVYADTFGAGAGTTLFFASSCTTARTASTTQGDAVCSSGACATSQSQVTALLDPGTHYLVYAGPGAATIHFQHAEVGTGAVARLPAGSSTTTGTTTGSGNLYACDAGGAENSYWWQTCPADAGGIFLGSTCTGTSFDTILSLQIPGSETVMCDDDTCSFQSTVSASIPAGAGLFVLAVDGFSQAKQGNYTLSASRP